MSAVAMKLKEPKDHMAHHECVLTSLVTQSVVMVFNNVQWTQVQDTGPSWVGFGPKGKTYVISIVGSADPRSMQFALHVSGQMMARSSDFGEPAECYGALAEIKAEHDKMVLA
jgi:hypothetical protein